MASWNHSLTMALPAQPAHPKAKKGGAAPQGAGGNLSSRQTVTGYEPFPSLRRPTRKNPGESPMERAMNNTSMFTADRMTHLKIVVVSLVCATLVAAVGVTSRIADAGTGRPE